jgi:CheY-like chemotaxis protein
LSSLRHPFSKRYYLVIRLLLGITIVLVMMLLVLPTSRLNAQAPHQITNTEPNLGILLLIIVVVIMLLAIPTAYYLWDRRRNPTRSLLMVSTDEEARSLVKKAARKVGYNAVTVYRYEDALDRLRQDISLNMIIVDDSVPQYEAGMLLSMLQRLPMGIRPLILIHDSSEAGQTAPSYRAEVVLERPITERAMEDAIRKVSERIDIDW